MDVRLRFTGGFSIEVDGKTQDEALTRSRKGVELMRYLILQNGASVSAQRLMRELDPERRCENPVSAMKTLISRTRAMLNAACPGLGACIAAGGGGYRWESLPGVSVDILELIDVIRRLKANPPPEQREQLIEQLLTLYCGELEGEYWLHREYLEAIYNHIAWLKEEEAYNRIEAICRRALQVDDLDEQLRILLIEALVNLNQNEAAMVEYQRVVRVGREYFHAEPSETLQEYYRAIIENSQSLHFNLNVIHNELMREENAQTGPYFCDYRGFREIYNIQIRNLERLGSTMFLAVIMLSSKSVAGREGGMAVLQEILRTNLRRGDIVTRFSDNIIAMLLPIVNYNSGSLVMERIERLFYQEYPGGNLLFQSRISPLGHMQFAGFAPPSPPGSVDGDIAFHTT